MCTHCLYHTCTACTITDGPEPLGALGGASDPPPLRRDRFSSASRSVRARTSPLGPVPYTVAGRSIDPPGEARGEARTHDRGVADHSAAPQWARRPMRWSARTRPGASPARTGTTPSDAGNSCPNLTQRRPALKSSVEKIPEYQRFSSRSPIGSGPLWRIWTRGAHLGHLTRSRGRPVAGTPGTGARPRPPPQSGKRTTRRRTRTYRSPGRRTVKTARPQDARTASRQVPGRTRVLTSASFTTTPSAQHASHG